MIRAAARASGRLAAAFLAAMMLLTVADVLLRALFSHPIQGVLELVELGLACTVFLALPTLFLEGQHLVVDTIDSMVSARARRALEFLGGAAAFGLLLLILSQMLPLARYTMRMGDVTSDLSIPRLWYWVPVLLGVAASALAAAAYLLRHRRAR